MLIFFNLKTIYLYGKMLNKYFLTDMPLRILFVTATQSEADALKILPGIKKIRDGFLFNNHEIIPLVTGVGSIATAWTMTKSISSGSKPDLALNAGIAGSYKDDLPAGKVVVPVSDCFADAGVDTGKGFLTLAEAGLEDPDRFPFRGGRIFSENKFVTRTCELLSPVQAITVNMATGSLHNIKMISDRYHPDIETMEGAAFFYICSRENIPFLALRSVSNMVGPRNKEKWNIRLALDTLSEELKKVLLLF
jgi:futalosine hydrolase